MTHTSQACPVCGEGQRTTLRVARTDEYGYQVCRACGTGQLSPMPARPEQFYTRNYFVEGGQLAGYVDYEADERWHRTTARSRLRRVRAALADEAVTPGGTDAPTPAKQLVDVGAATGFFLDVAREQGWQVAGVEASEWAADRARSRGHRMESNLADYDGDLLDAVTFFQVLEHFPDPQQALVQAAALLRPGGVVVCETWDAASRTARWSGSHWQQLSPPSVLWLFTRTGMAHMAEAAGLELVGWRVSPKLISLATVLGQSIPATNQGAAARVLRRAGQVIALPYPLDDLVTAVLRRPADAPRQTKSSD